MQDLWLLKRHTSSDPRDGLPNLIEAQASTIQKWHALDGSMCYLYASGNTRPSHSVAGSEADWLRLRCVQELPGASFGHVVTKHYVVETDVLPEFEEDLNAWYAQEHLPGLASVPGTVRATRYVDATGSPKFYACYDLVSADTLGSPAWLAVRATPWSSRVRPAFRNTRRTMFGKTPPDRSDPFL
ncbi:hypothetical protein WKW80_21235 [Variovorax humicola]|uniref:Uncharacterized protein n=1 Tax=Variovorax humicola TaxID=1769758 RepID=A0ABU8W390_9BURK